MKQLYALLLVALLTGCASVKPPEFVSASSPKVVMPAQPVWAIQGITQNTPDGEVSSRWLAFKEQSLGYIKELQTTLKPFTKD